VSRVRGAHLREFAPGPYFKVAAVASRWQRVGDFIGSTSYHLCHLPGGNLLIDVIQEENITLFLGYFSVTATNDLIQYS